MKHVEGNDCRHRHKLPFTKESESSVSTRGACNCMQFVCETRAVTARKEMVEDREGVCVCMSVSVCVTCV